MRQQCVEPKHDDINHKGDRGQRQIEGKNNEKGSHEISKKDRITNDNRDNGVTNKKDAFSVTNETMVKCSLKVKIIQEGHDNKKTAT